MEIRVRITYDDDRILPSLLLFSSSSKWLPSIYFRLPFPSAYFPSFFPLEETLEDTYQTTNPRDFPYYTPSPLRENKRDSS